MNQSKIKSMAVVVDSPDMFPSYILTLALSGDLPPLNQVEDVLSVHQYLRNEQAAKKLRRTLTRQWINEGLCDPTSNNLIREWIPDNLDIAAIIVVHGYHNAFSISHNPIDNDLFWRRVKNKIDQYVPMTEVFLYGHKFLRRCLTPTWIEYISNQWDNDKLHRLATNCTNNTLSSIYLGLKLNQALVSNMNQDIDSMMNQDLNSMISEYGKINKRSRMTIVWACLGRNNHRIETIHRLIDVHPRYCEPMVNGIIGSNNLELFKIFFDYVKHDLSRVIRSIHQLGTIEMIDYANRLSSLTNRSLAEIARRSWNADTYMAIKDRLVDIRVPPSLHALRSLLADGRLSSPELWLRYSRGINTLIYDLIIDDKIEQLKTIPIKLVNDNPVLILKLRQLGVELTA